MQSPAWCQKLATQRHKLLVRVTYLAHKHELLVRAQNRATKTFLFDSFWCVPYIVGRNIHIYSMKKSLRGCEQIILVIMLYPGTKFELICPAKKN